MRVLLTRVVVGAGALVLGVAALVAGEAPTPRAFDERALTPAGSADRFAGIPVPPARADSDVLGAAARTPVARSLLGRLSRGVPDRDALSYRFRVWTAGTGEIRGTGRYRTRPHRIVELAYPGIAVAERPDLLRDLVVRATATTVYSRTRVYSPTEVYPRPEAAPLAAGAATAPGGALLNAADGWVSFPLAEATGLGAAHLQLLGPGGIADPATHVELVRAAGEVRALGRARVRQSPVQRYRVTVDLEALRSAGVLRSWFAALQAAGRGTTMDQCDLWVDRRGRVLRVTGGPGGPQLRITITGDRAGALRVPVPTRVRASSGLAGGLLP